MLATAAGFTGGWVFYKLWRGLLPRGHGREFWTSMPGSLRQMLETEDNAQVMRQYKALMLGIASHTGRNLWAVLVGIAPLTIFCALFDVLGTRPAGLNRNPLTPHLDDFEFVLFLSAAFGSAVAAWRSRLKS